MTRRNRLPRLSPPGALLALALALCPAVRAARMSVVVDGRKSGDQALINVLKKDLGPGNRILIYNIRGVDLSNPVAKGRFLSQVADADLIVPVGDPATQLIATELEDQRSFFIAAAALSGVYLNRRHVEGILSYSPEETVRTAKALLPRMKAMGILYTPGYEPVIERMKDAAHGQGVFLVLYPVSSRHEIGPIVRDAALRTDFLWIVGDPLLTQDLTFNYLLQESFRLKKPLAAPLPSLVERGALFCTVPDNDKVARQASATLSRLLSSDFRPGEADRVQAAPEDGFLLLNHRLAAKWEIRVPPFLRTWRGDVP